VAPGEKGVQHETLPPGLEYYNPYLKQIDVVDVRSHKYDMIGDESIQFPSNDSFTISIDGTIEWAIRPDRVAEVTVAYGDAEDILNKIILPNARSIARIQGSKLLAREFISGKTRTAFQDKLHGELRAECWKQGIDIKSSLVRDIVPPAEIASPISQREQADQEIQRSTNEMAEAKSEARLVNATNRPVSLITGPSSNRVPNPMPVGGESASPLPASEPVRLRLTSVVVSDRRSRTKMSSAPFPSTATRSLARLANATCRPSRLIVAWRDGPSPGAFAARLMLTNSTIALPGPTKMSVAPFVSSTLPVASVTRSNCEL
jgi:hypothetical protein